MANFLSGTKALFAIIAIAMLFFFINSPIESVQKSSTIILLIISGLGFFIFSEKEYEEFFAVRGIRDLLSNSFIGIIFGVISLLVTTVLIKGLNSVYNLLGTISSISSTAYGAEQQLYTIWFFPLAETLILLGGVFALTRFFPKIRFGRINLTIVISFFIVMMVFSAFHFADRGKDYFDATPTGFINFVTNTQDFGTSTYVGALPQLILAGLWLIGAYLYRSFLIPAFAHIFANAFSLGLFLGFFQPVILLTFALLGIIVFYGITRTNALSELFSPHGDFS